MNLLDVAIAAESMGRYRGEGFFDDYLLGDAGWVRLFPAEMEAKGRHCSCLLCRWLRWSSSGWGKGSWEVETEELGAVDVEGRKSVWE